MKTYIFTTCYRGVLNVGNMRTFTTKEEVVDHIIAHPGITDDHRIYEANSDRKPVVITREIEKMVIQVRASKRRAK